MTGRNGASAVAPAGFDDEPGRRADDGGDSAAAVPKCNVKSSLKQHDGNADKKDDGPRGVTSIEDRGGSVPDKSPKKPSAKKTADRSLKEKRQDKKDKRTGFAGFGG